MPKAYGAGLLSSVKDLEVPYIRIVVLLHGIVHVYVCIIINICSGTLLESQN